MNKALNRFIKGMKWFEKAGFYVTSIAPISKESLDNIKYEKIVIKNGKDYNKGNQEFGRVYGIKVMKK